MNNFSLYEELHRADGTTVYKARKKGSIEYFAVKSTEKSRKAAVVGAVEALQCMAGITGILHVEQWYETRNHVWACMQLCPGGDLARALIEDGRFPETSVREVGIQIAAALLAAHTRGTLHGAISTSHVLFADDGAIRLTSWVQCQRACWTSWANFPVSEDLAGLGRVLGEACRDPFSESFQSLLKLLGSGCARWESVITHEFWNGRLLSFETGTGSCSEVLASASKAAQPLGPIGSVSKVKPAAQAFRNSDVMDQSVLETERSSSGSGGSRVSLCDLFKRARESFSRHLSCCMKKLQPIVEFGPLAAVSGQNIDELFADAPRLFCDDSCTHRTSLAFIAAGPIAWERLFASKPTTAALVRAAGRSDSAVTLLGLVIRQNSRHLSTPMYGVAETLGKEAARSAQALAALGELLLASTHRAEEWTQQLKSALNTMRAAISKPPDYASFGIACRTVDSVAVANLQLARQYFPGAAQHITAMLGNLPPDILPSAVCALAALGETPKVPTNVLRMCLDRNLTRAANILLTSCKLQLGDWGTLARRRDSVGTTAFFTLCDCFEKNPENAIAAAGNALDARRGGEACEGVHAFMGILRAALIEGKPYHQVLEFGAFSALVIDSKIFCDLLTAAVSRGSVVIASVASALHARGNSIRDYWNELVESGFLLGALKLSLDQETNTKLMIGLMQILGICLGGDCAMAAARFVAEHISPKLDSSYLQGLKDPAPSCILSTICQAARVDREIILRSLDPRIYEVLNVVEERLPRENACATLSLLISANMYCIFERGDSFDKVTREVIYAKPDCDGSARAAALLIIETLHMHRDNRIERLMFLMVPLVKLSNTSHWAAELLTQLSVALGPRYIQDLGYALGDALLLATNPVIIEALLSAVKCCILRTDSEVNHMKDGIQSALKYTMDSTRMQATVLLKQLCQLGNGN